MFTLIWSYLIIILNTVIHEVFVKIFRFAQNDENFLHKNCLLIMLYTVDIILWCALDMNENIVTQKFLTQKIVNEINANYGSCFIYYTY